MPPNINLAHFAHMVSPMMAQRGAPPMMPAMARPPMPMRPPMPQGMMPPAAPSMGAPPGAPPQMQPMGAGMPPGQPAPPPVNPLAAKIANVIRPAAAAQGRGGDSMVAHMTPGEIAVPPQVQTPDVLAALNKAFAASGANPTSFQAGNPDQKINPNTGMPEFGFFDIALPLALGVAGSMFLGPEMLAPALMEMGVGGTTAGILGGALGGGLGSFAGNAITGKPLDQSLASAAGGAAGSALLGGALGGFGSGPTPVTEVGPGVGLASDAIRNPAGMADLAGGGLSGTGAPLTGAPITTAGAPPVSAMSPAAANSLGAAWDKSGALSQTAMPGPIAAPDQSFMDSLIDRVGNMNVKQTIGSALGGQIGSSWAESMFPPKTPAPDLGPHLRPVGPISNTIGGGAPSSNGPIPFGAYRAPPASYRPGIDPQFNYFG